MDGQPDEELQRERSGRVVSIGASVSMELGMYLPPWKLSNPYFWDFYGALSHRHGPLLIPFSGLPPLKRMGDTAENSKLSNHSLVFLVTSSSRSLPRVPSQNKRYSYHLENYKGFRSPVSGTGVKDQILEWKNAPMVFLSLRKGQGFQELCARNQRQGPVFSITSH